MAARISGWVIAAACFGACNGGNPVEGDGGGSDGIDSLGDGSTGAGSGDAGGSDGAPTTDGDGDGDGGGDGLVPKFDVAGFDDVVDCKQMSGGQVGSGEFSIIWIANSTEGTVSKIDTQTAMEVARYRTGEGFSDPSRTSVNLSGDVAVTNRRGSVTKIAARLEDCVDNNGDMVITTSQDKDDVLAWGEDECVLWTHETGFDSDLAGSHGGPRGTAWTGGEVDADTCEVINSNLWVGWRNQPDTSVTVRLIDGDDGSTVGEVLVADWPSNWGHGVYGGAADADGNFWGLGTEGTVFKISDEDFSVERFDNPASHTMYGIALDAEGTPWIAGYSGNLWSLDVGAATWVDKGPAAGGSSRMRGLAIDADGYAWIAGNSPCGLVQYDTTSDVFVDTQIALPGCSSPVGVSIDVDGMIWVVDKNADKAFKVDPTDYSVVEVDGLVDPYTYSDMTGAGLDLVINPPG